MALHHATELGSSIQAICESQQKAIARLIVEVERQAPGTSGPYLDFFHAGLSGRFPVALENGAHAERNVRELENLMTRTQRLIAVNQAIAALVQEVSQQLAAIGSYAAGCRDGVQPGRHEDADRVLPKIIDRVDSALQITQRTFDLVGTRSPLENAPAQFPWPSFTD